VCITLARRSLRSYCKYSFQIICKSLSSPNVGIWQFLSKFHHYFLKKRAPDLEAKSSLVVSKGVSIWKGFD